MKPDQQIADSADQSPTCQFDPGTAHPARVYCYWLGGKDHFPRRPARW